MALIRNDEVQAAIISSLLADLTVTAELVDCLEVREAHWKGQEFTYPNIRVEMSRNNPSQGGEHCLSEIGLNIYVYSEEASSRQANRIAGIIADKYHNKSLNSGGLFFTRFRADIIPAISQNITTWRSQVTLSSTVGRT